MRTWVVWTVAIVVCALVLIVVSARTRLRARVAMALRRLGARMTRDWVERIAAVGVFAVAVACALVAMYQLGGAMAEPRYHRPARCEAEERKNTKKPDLSDDEFKALLSKQVEYRKRGLGSPPDFSYRSLTQGQADEILKAQDDAKNDPPMKRANLAHANLSDLKLRNVDFGGADLTCANFLNASLPGAIFDEAFLEGAVFQDVKEAEGARFNRVSAPGADFTRANLRKASFDQAKSLAGATFTDTDVNGASFAAADLTDAFWSPVSTPAPAKIARAMGLETLRPAPFGAEEKPSLVGLQLLARELKKGGESSAKDRVTRAYEAAETRRMWAEGDTTSFDGIITRLLALWRRFTWGALTDYGLSPGRALVALLLVAMVFSPLYWAEIPFDRTQSLRLRRIRPKDTLDENGALRGADTVEGISATSWVQRARSAFVASLESTLNVGFGEVKLSEWLSRFRRTEEEMAVVGWLRMMGGVQSVIATVVFILWVWCLLGDPFGEAGAG
jgi:hypothetical protein